MTGGTAIDGSRAESMLLLPGCVGFYLAARLCITYLFFQAEPQTGAMLTFALQSALLTATVFYSFGPGSVSPWSMMRIAPFRWVLAFLGVGLCSLDWSVTASVPVAFAYWSELAGQAAMMVLLLRVGDRVRIAESVIHGYVAGALVIGIIMWLSPTMRDLRPGNDEFFSPNAIGFTCALAVFLLQYLARKHGQWGVGSRAAALFLAIALLRSLSKTTLIAFAAGQVYLLLRDRAISLQSKVMLTTASLGAISAFWPLIARYAAIYENAGNQAETLTGRLGIWALVLERSLERPWLGHGFHSFRNVIPPFGSFEAWHAHNELLQQFYAYGIVGIVLLIGAYGSLLRYTHQVATAEVRPLMTSLLIFVAVRGLADTENFDLSLPLWLIALLSLTLTAERRSGVHERPMLSASSLAVHGGTP